MKPPAWYWLTLAARRVPGGTREDGPRPGPASNPEPRMLQRNKAQPAWPMRVRTSNSSGKKYSSSACFRNPTPLEPPVPRL
jgi:hypothetical protein